MRHTQTVAKYSLLMVALFATRLCLAVDKISAFQLPGKPAPEWDSLFQRTNGWIGADGAFSIPLATNRTLWLFGDTFVGDVKDGKRVNARMINNSVAIQSDTSAPEFFYRTNLDDKPEAFFKPTATPGYFWPFHGIRTKQGLYVFLHRVENVKTGTPFGFHIVGLWLAHIPNPDEMPLRWKIAQQKFPFAQFASKGLLTFSSALVRHEHFIYVFGEDSRDKSKRGMIVARVPENKFPDFKQWRFWNGRQWQKDFEQVSVICTNIPSEFSVSWQPAMKRFVLVYSEATLSGKIFMQRAPAPEGRWTNPIQIYEAPEMKWKEKVFSYAAKAHPEFSADDELLVTYAVNAWDFWSLFNDARLYWPRFVRIKVADLGVR